MNQSFWQSLYRIWMWLGVPVMVIALTALGMLIAGVVGAGEEGRLCSRVPLAERQEIQFAEAGRVVLSMEGPHLSSRFARIDFELSGIDGDKIEGRRAWFRCAVIGHLEGANGVAEVRYSEAGAVRTENDRAGGAPGERRQTRGLVRETAPRAIR